MVAFGLLTIHTVSCHLLPMPPCFALSPKSLCVSMEDRVCPYSQVVAGERSIGRNCSIGSREEFSQWWVLTLRFMGFPADRGDNPPLSGHDRVAHNACVPLTHNSYVLPTPSPAPDVDTQMLRCLGVCSNSALGTAGNFSYSRLLHSHYSCPAGHPAAWLDPGPHEAIVRPSEA